jgi:uncharacterized RDD family membrane protein YckC
MPSYHIAQNGAPAGIFTEAEIQSGLQSGRFSPNDLLWSEGMSEWLPVATRFSVAPAPPSTPPAANPYPSAQPIPGPTVNPYAPSASVIAMEMPPLRLASLGSRVAAVLLDSLVLGVATIPVGIGLAIIPDVPDPTSTAQEPANILMVVGILLFLGVIAIDLYLLAARGQTLGKKWMHIRIASHPDGGNPGLVKTLLLRGFVNGVLSNLTSGIYGLVDFCFVFREDRRCLHDLLAGTVVVAGDPES